jgi:biotin-[acetyl-CoA-carboxylase] ligase BirA-like protein
MLLSTELSLIKKEMEPSNRKWILVGLGVGAAAAALYLLTRRQSPPVHLAVVSDSAFDPVEAKLKELLPTLSKVDLAALSQSADQFNLSKFYELLGKSTNLSVVYSTSTSSTNTLLTQALKDLSFPGPALYIADVQTQGRGRTGSWTSPNGCLMFSYVFTCLLKNAVAIQAVIPLAIVSAIQSMLAEAGLSAPTLKVKWPNDVYLGDQKISGVLVDSDSVNGLCRMVIGVGINLSNTEPTTCLEAHFPRVFTREALIVNYLRTFNAMVLSLQSGFEAIQEQYKANWMHLNKPVRYQGQLLTLVDLNLAEGSLVGVTEQGTVVAVKSREGLDFLS